MDTYDRGGVIRCFDEYDLFVPLSEAKAVEVENARLKAEIARMKEHTWCAYCGLEIHIDDEAASKISEHILSCEKHPLCIAVKENARLKSELAELKKARQYVEWMRMEQLNNRLKIELAEAKSLIDEATKLFGLGDYADKDTLDKADWLAKAREGIQRSVDLVGGEHIPQGLKDLSQALDIIESQREALREITKQPGYPDDLDGDPCECTACQFARIAREELEKGGLDES